MKASSIFPLVFFFALALGLAAITGLGSKPNFIPRMIGKKIDTFQTEEIVNGGKFSTEDFKGKIVILNAFASWCESCKVEHPFIKELADKGYEVYGLDVNDSKEKALSYLKANGNPYKKVGFDGNFQISIGLGITALPETFVISQDGVIFFHQRGGLDQEIIDKQIIPVIEGLQKK